MVIFNTILIFTVCLYLGIAVFECQSLSLRNRCSTIRLNNGRVRTRSSGRVLRISCNWPFKLVRGNEIMTCVRGEWDSEYPICARAGCPIVEEIAHGRLNVVDEGAKLEVTCDVGYTIDGPSFIYCNELLEWNQQLKGCKEHDQIHLSCDFESSDERFCGWKNDIYNDVDWLADKTTSFLLFTSRRHVTPGSSQYFTSNYISLDAGNYGSSTAGRLLSPPLLPVQNKQMCLIFSYKVTSGTSSGTPFLTVTFGGIPHWATSGGEGRVIIGLYRFNVTSKIVIEGKSCKAAIDNMVITEGNSCTRQAYEEEDYITCGDNCGRITNSFFGCSCDWECHNNNNCCSDIKQKCPYIKPLEEVSKLYLTSTTVTPIKVTAATVINSISNTTVSNIIFSSKIINESEVSNNSTTPMSEYNNVTVTKITTMSTVTPPVLTSNITVHTFPPTPPTMPSTISPITITVTIPSTTISRPTKPPPDSSVSLRFIHFPTTLNSTTTSSSIPKSYNITIPNITTNISAMTTKVINASSVTIKFVTPSITSTIPLINITSSSISPLKLNLTSTTKLTSTSSSIIKFVLPNVTSTTSVLINNTSSSTIKPPKININTSTKKIYIPTVTMIKYMTSNIPAYVEQYPTTINKSRSIPKNIPNVITESKPAINNSTIRIPNVIGYSNIPSAVPNKQFVVFDISQPNPNLIPLKYNITFKNITLSSNNNSFSNVTTQSTYYSELKSNTFWKNVRSTTIETPHEKPELNYSLHNQHMLHVDKWLADNSKQNENDESSHTYNTVSIIKYIAAISVILVTFKYAFSFIKWYFKKPTNDEMNACFIETDTESYNNIELTSNRVE